MDFFGATIPFADHCRIEPVEIGNGRSRLRVVVGPEHMNNVGIAHGGLICTLLDIAMGTAARSAAGRPVVTLDMQVGFMAPGRGALIAEGRVARAGRSIVFTEAEARTEDGTLIAKASGLFKTTGIGEQEGGAPDRGGSAA